jgi:hypothetical protein
MVTETNTPANEGAEMATSISANSAKRINRIVRMFSPPAQHRMFCRTGRFRSSGEPTVPIFTKPRLYKRAFREYVADTQILFIVRSFALGWENMITEKNYVGNGINGLSLWYMLMPRGRERSERGVRTSNHDRTLDQRGEGARQQPSPAKTGQLYSSEVLPERFGRETDGSGKSCSQAHKSLPVQE